MSDAPRERYHADDPVIKPGRRVLGVHPGADAYTALMVMRRNEVRHLPVLDGDRCVGLLTEFDLLRALASAVSADRLTAGALCRRPAPSVPAGSSLQTMAATMVGAGADALLVVQQGVMVGMVTGSDVLGAVTRPWLAPAEPAATEPAATEPAARLAAEPVPAQPSRRGTP